MVGGGNAGSQIWYQLHRTIKPMTRATSLKELFITTKQAFMQLTGST
jgi:hypothetical protein